MIAAGVDREGKGTAKARGQTLIFSVLPDARCGSQNPVIPESYEQKYRRGLCCRGHCLVLKLLACDIASMTRDQVKAALDRVLTWPQKRQEEAVEILKVVEEQDASNLRLSDEQLAEVRRRRQENNPNRIPFDEVFRRFHARNT